MPRIILYFGLGLIALASGLWVWDANQSAKNTVSNIPLSLMAPAGGRPFALTDHDGKAVTDKDYKGKFMLVAFGYTYCPDVCPTGLQGISEALDILGDKADWVRPLFVTIDPERDTAASMKEYVAAFHPRLIGLTGTLEEVAAAAKSYRVYYNKLEIKGEDGKVMDKDDYFMGHTTTVYLIGPDGRDREIFSFSTTPEVMADRMTHFINVAIALNRPK